MTGAPRDAGIGSRRRATRAAPSRSTTIEEYYREG